MITVCPLISLHGSCIHQRTYDPVPSLSIAVLSDASAYSAAALVATHKGIELDSSLFTKMVKGVRMPTKAKLKEIAKANKAIKSAKGGAK